MWQLLPVALLVLTLLALGASNLQRGFRSNWLLSLGGTALAWLSLLVLRFRLPQSVELPAWWAGQGVDYFATFTLDEISWPLAFVVASLLLVALLGQVRRAMSANWASWAPGLAAGAALLLACLSAGWLTFAFTWILVDLLTFSLSMFGLKAEQRQQAVQVFAANLVASLLLVTAWVLSFYGAELRGVLVIFALSLRLGLWNPQSRLALLVGARADQQAIFVLAPMAPSLALLARFEPLPDPWGALLFAPLILLALYYAARWFARGEMAYWQLGLAGLAMAAALLGQSLAVLAFAILLLLGGGLLLLVQRAGRYRLPAAIAAGLLLSGLPFTASAWIATLAAAPAWQSVLTLLVLSILLAGWLRQALQPAQQALPPEPWMRSVRWIGLAIAPAVWLLFGIGLLPYFGQSLALPWWPPVIVTAAAGLLFVGAGRFKGIQNTPFNRVAQRIAAVQWQPPLRRAFSQAVSAPLGLLAGLLEGRAGILWAMLFMALLLAMVAQYGVGG